MGFGLGMVVPGYGYLALSAGFVFALAVVDLVRGYWILSELQQPAL